TLATADRGNMSDAVVKRFADHPWCAAAARLTNPMVRITLLVNGAKTTGTTHSAQISIVSLRAELMLQPRLIRLDDIHPPPTLPTSASRYTAMVGHVTCSRVRPKTSCIYLGNQNR